VGPQPRRVPWSRLCVTMPSNPRLWRIRRSRMNSGSSERGDGAERAPDSDFSPRIAKHQTPVRSDGRLSTLAWSRKAVTMAPVEEEGEPVPPRWGSDRRMVADPGLTPLGYYRRPHSGRGRVWGRRTRRTTPLPPYARGRGHRWRAIAARSSRAIANESSACFNS